MANDFPVLKLAIYTQVGVLVCRPILSVLSKLSVSSAAAAFLPLPAAFRGYSYTILNPTYVQSRSLSLIYLVSPGGIEPLSSVLLLYAPGLEVLCRNRGQRSIP